MALGGSSQGAVDGFGGFEQQYRQIEKVSAHHRENWEVLLYGHLVFTVVERSRLVADLAAGRRGGALRDIQYL